MVFKARFFSSSKKSDSSSTDGSNSPRTPAAASSPFRSSSKRLQSSSRWRSGKDVVPMHQLLQQLKDSPPSAGHVASPPDAAASGSLSPIGASSLGLNRIKTRSGPLPQEWFKDHRIPGLGAGNRTRASLSSVSTLMSASALKRSSKKVPEPPQAASRGARGVSERPDSRLCGPDQSSPQMETIITERNRFEDMKNSDACNSDAKTPNDFCETPKESESPRFKARMQATNVPRRRSPTDIKSFSHELNSKGVCPFPFWKPRNTYNLKEVLKVIQVKFEKAKEEVNSDLVIFAGDLLGVMEKNAENHPEWMETLEDLLLLARKCSFMEPGQFWMHCEGIVQHLDDQRQELPMGALKKLYTHMLFILTRCTRLVQFHKESGFTEGEFIMDHQDSRFIHSVEKDNLLSETDGRKEAIVSQKSYSQEKHNLNRKKPQEIIKPLNSFTSVDVPAMKSREEASQIKDEPFNRKLDSSRILNKGDNYDRDLVMNRLPELPSSGDSSVHPVIPSKHQYKISWGGHWADQKNISQDGSIMCRICEEYVPTLFMEDHSKICAIANRCDQKGLSVDDRLLIIAETLERFVESFSQKDLPNVAGTSDFCVTQDTGILSPKLSEWSRRGSADMLDCFQEPDKSIFQDDIKNFPTMVCNTRFGPKSDQGKSSSSASITPRSPLMTPRTTHIDMLLAGRTALSENDDLPQIAELADIARCIAKTSLYDEQSLSNLVSSVQALQGVINRQKLDALTVQTFGARIEKLHREKYLQLCDTVDVEKVDLASTAMDEEEDVVRSLRTSPVHPTSKDRISIDDFEIIKPISRGAFGRVFLAKKRTTGDIFAIKVLKKADMIRKNAVESILAERDILISVRNPFVVRFFYSFTSRENLYLVMEYLNGGDLYSLLRNLGCLDEEVTRIYIAEVVLALEYLHSLCVVHRDLKPDNLLIAHDGHIKLTDFGLSKVGLINSTDDLSGPAVSDTKLLVEDEPQIPISEHSHQHVRQKERSAVGTPDYLAPEILLGTRHGASADWWSVGVILFELIVGIPPFNADHPQTIFDNILNRKIPWPKVPEEMSFDARDLIDKLLTEDPTERLGAKGASEVKEHSFFKDINWDTLARQKAAFIPSSDGVFDTSYFTSRYTWNSLEEQNYEASEFEDSTDDDSISGNSSCISHHDEPEDEFEGLAGFEPGSSVNYSFSNFSYKNLSQLALINYDLLSKGWNEELPTICDP